MATRSFALPLRTLAIAIVYAVTARFGQTFAIEPGNVTPVWIPGGIAVGVIALWGTAPWQWSGVWLGAFAYNFWFFLAGGMIDPPVAIFLAMGIATGNTLMAIAGGTLIASVRGFEEDLGRPRDAFAVIVLAGFLATTISATMGTAVLLLAEQLVSSRVGLVWTTWWFGDANGVILITPLILLFGRLGLPRYPGPRAWIAGTGAVLLAVMLTLIFGPHALRNVATIGLAFPVAFLSFTAFLLGRRATVLAAAVIASIAVWSTARGVGPLHGSDLNESLILLHAFLDTAALTGLLLATTVRGARHLGVGGGSVAVPARPAPSAEPFPTELERSIAQRRREEAALADRVRALAEEARTLERQLESSAVERNAVMAVLPDLFYVLDRTTQRFVMTSESFAREVAGMRRDELVGRSPYDVLPPELALRLGEQHREVFSTGDLLHVVETLPLPDGPREFDTLKAPYHGPDGEVAGLVSASRPTVRPPS